MNMNDLYRGNRLPCDCGCDEPQRNRPPCDCGCGELQPIDCKYEIICSQSHVAECEAKLFCDVTNRLRCEIKHACCQKELAQLIALTNQFLTASAKKEIVFADIVGHCRNDVTNIPV